MAQGGKTLNDRKLAAEVRTLALHKVKKILQTEPADDEARRLHDAVLLRLSATILPRLNEHTGADGDTLPPLTVINYGDIKPPVQTEGVSDTPPEILR
jgi:hypothetical protein